MKMKLAVAVVALIAVSGFAQAQKAAPKGAKPSVADAQKILQAISTDQAKVKIYCDAAKLLKQVDTLDPKKDKKKVDDLYKQADSLEQKLGPDYVRLTIGINQIDPSSAEGKEYGAAFGVLDKQCGG